MPVTHAEIGELALVIEPGSDVLDLQPASAQYRGAQILQRLSIVPDDFPTAVQTHRPAADSAFGRRLAVKSASPAIADPPSPNAAS